MWYTVEDNPEITAALEEERASSLSRKNSPRAKRGEASNSLTVMTFLLGFNLGCVRLLHATPTQPRIDFLCSSVEVVTGEELASRE